MISPVTLDFFVDAFNSELPECGDFGQYIQTFSGSVAKMVEKTIPQANSTFEDKYLTSPSRKFFENPGKCARPLICLLANSAFGGNVKEAVVAAMAVEAFQNAALIHDDIADDATTRRNEPCLHISEGLGIALNAGDFALSLVDELVMSDTNLSDNMKLMVLQELNNMKLKTIAGQAIDIGWARDHKFDLKVSDYFNMATLKTAHYTCATPIVVGAMIAGENKKALSLLREFGAKCGLAFQIQDDILNIDKSSKDSSKDFALDIKEGKRTLIVIHAINHLPTSKSEKLAEILDCPNKTEKDIEQALALINEANSIEFAKEKCKSLIDESNDIISFCENSSCAYKIMCTIPNWCLNRKN